MVAVKLESAKRGAEMNIDEAITHAREVASRMFDDRVHCIKCAEEHEQLAEWLAQLKEYQQLEEQGRLIKLPCKVGDKIFLDFAGFGKDVDKFTVKDFHLDCFEDGETILFCDYESDDRTLSGQIDVMEFGKTVFCTKSEAETKLKELRGVENKGVFLNESNFTGRNNRY